MKAAFVLTVFLSLPLFSQIRNIPKSSMLNIQNGDSVIFYQCHIKEHYREVNLPSGDIETNGIEKYTLTEKFVIIRSDDKFSYIKYSSPMVPFPNRRFSGLKIREKSYWEFFKDGSGAVTAASIARLVELEKNGREAIEFDYAITKYTTNQVIIKHGKGFKQLVIDGALLNDIITSERQ
jgi:hypothetical protein